MWQCTTTVMECYLVVLAQVTRIFIWLLPPLRFHGNKVWCNHMERMVAIGTVWHFHALWTTSLYRIPDLENVYRLISWDHGTFGTWAQGSVGLMWWWPGRYYPHTLWDYWGLSQLLQDLSPLWDLSHRVYAPGTPGLVMVWECCADNADLPTSLLHPSSSRQVCYL